MKKSSEKNLIVFYLRNYFKLNFFGVFFKTQFNSLTSKWRHLTWKRSVCLNLNWIWKNAKILLKSPNFQKKVFHQKVMSNVLRWRGDDTGFKPILSLYFADVQAQLKKLNSFKLSFRFNNLFSTNTLFPIKFKANGL
jgi:hypothetical protein